MVNIQIKKSKEICLNDGHWVGSLLLTCQDNISVLSSSVKQSKNDLDCLTHEDGTGTLAQNASNKLPINTMQQPRRAKTSTAPQQKPKISHIQMMFANINDFKTTLLQVYKHQNQFYTFTFATGCPEHSSFITQKPCIHQDIP
jgi:hypothetical protein